MSPSFWERCSRRCLKSHCALGTHTILNRNKFTRCRHDEVVIDQQQIQILKELENNAEGKEAYAQEMRQKARTGEELSISREQAKKRASHALCSAALAGKLVQGTPVIGVYGGFRNGVLLRQGGNKHHIAQIDRLAVRADGCGRCDNTNSRTYPIFCVK